ncbi:MAG: mannonate dehydratase [Bryobacteraceae bacterium]
MQRRHFLAASASAAALSSCVSSTTQTTTTTDQPWQDKPVRLHVGTQRGPTDEQMLQYLKRHGVNHICAYAPKPPYPQRGYWEASELSAMKELCDKHGIVIETVAAPFLASSHIDREERPNIMLGKEPERQRDIDDICKCIENVAKAGLPGIKYNMSILGVVRTERTAGRGGSTYSTWNLAKAQADPKFPKETKAGTVDEATAWERITHFVKAVMPVAHANKVKMACHPHDPGMPPEGFENVVRVLGTPQGLYKMAGLFDSPYHGFNLCLGTTAEMLQDPKKEIHDVIRTLGKQKKIFNIHFRNIRGHRDDFQEVYPDEGDMLMPQVLRTLYEIDYPYMLMPDHMPQHPDDAGGRQAFAFAFGYINGLIQSLKYELGQPFDAPTDDKNWFPA